MEDLRAVVKTVKSLKYVDSSEVYLLGSSQGGLVSALLADECPDEFAGMILFYPAFNIPDMVKLLNSSGKWGDLGSLGGMLTMSEKYIIVPISYSEKAIGLYPSASLNKIEGASHGFNTANLGEMGSLLGASADYDSQVMPIVQEFLKK